VKQEGGWGKEKRERRGKKGIERGGEKFKVVKRGNLERIQRSKVGLGVEEGLEIIGRSKEMTQEELQRGTKMKSKEESGVEGQCRHQLGEEEYMKKVSQSPNFQEEETLSGRKCMGNQEKRKEDYVGKTMGGLGTLNWREWERTRVPQWMVEGLREGFWWEVQPGLERKKFPNAKMTAEQMEFVDKVWEEWKAQGVLESGIVKCVCRMKVTKKKGPKKWRLCINNRPVNKKVLKWKVKFERIEMVKELMKMFGWGLQFDLEIGYLHVMFREDFRGCQNQGGAVIYKGSYPETKVREFGVEDQLGEVSVGPPKVDQIYRLLGKLRGEVLGDPRGQVGEVESSYVEGYKRVGEVRRDQVEKGSKGNGSVGERERGLVSGPGIFQGRIQDFTTSTNSKLGDKSDARSSASRGSHLDNKVISNWGQEVNTTNREGNRGVVRCFTNRLGLCNTRVRGKRSLGRTRGGAVNKQKRVTGILEGVISSGERGEGKGAQMDRGQWLAERGVNMVEPRWMQMGGQGRLEGGRLGVSASRRKMGPTQHRQICRREEQQVQKMEQQVLDNRGGKQQMPSHRIGEGTTIGWCHH
jgi:hypothetical protein